MDVTSPKGLSNIATLLQSRSEINVARSLRGDKAQRFIDRIDQVSELSPTLSTRRFPGTDRETQVLKLPQLDQKMFRPCSRLLYKICKARGVLPTTCTIQQELLHVGEFEWSGGFADVGKGEYQGLPVAIKQLRIRAKSEIDDVFKVSNRTRPGTLQSLILDLGALSGSSYLEIFVSSERPASVGGFCN